MTTTKWNGNWKRSTQPRKQRLYVYNAPLHVKNKMVGSHLSKELQKKYETRTVRVRTGDSIKVLRGQYRGKTGKVERVSVKNAKIYVTGIEVEKRDGSKAMFPIHASNVIIQTLDTSDKRRFK